MRHARLISIGVASLLIAGLAANSPAQTPSGIPSYYNQNLFNLTSPTALPTPAGGFANPAVWGIIHDSFVQFAWTNDEDRIDKAEEWGGFVGGEHVGFGIVENRVLLSDGTMGTVQDMRIALVDHHWRTRIGVAYGWSRRDERLAGRSDMLQVGMVHRIGRFAAIGAVGNFAIQGSGRSGLFDVSVRPLGEWLTVFADAELPRGISASDAPWSAGLVFEAIPGLEVSSRYFSTENYNIAVGFKFYGFWLTGSPQYNGSNERTSTTYDVRF